MTKQTAAELISTYLDHIAKIIDLNSLQEIDFYTKTIEKLQIGAFQIFQASYRQDPGSRAVFVFTYLQTPDELIPHKLLNLTHELSWHFAKNPQMQALPAIFPVVLYNGQKQWTPRNVKQLYSKQINMPDFFFEFIDLQRGIVQTI